MWVRLDDGFADDPRILRAGPRAAWLHVEVLCYSARHLTNGFIPDRFVTRQTRLVGRLIEAGLWEKVEGGYRVLDYLLHNPSAAEVQAHREVERAVRSAGGRTRAASARREGGRFLPAGSQQSDQQSAGNPADSVHQQATSPVPVLVSDNTPPLTPPKGGGDGLLAPAASPSLSPQQAGENLHRLAKMTKAIAAKRVMPS